MKKKLKEQDGYTLPMVLVFLVVSLLLLALTSRSVIGIHNMVQERVDIMQAEETAENVCDILIREFAMNGQLYPKYLYESLGDDKMTELKAVSLPSNVGDVSVRVTEYKKGNIELNVKSVYKNIERHAFLYYELVTETYSYVNEYGFIEYVDVSHWNLLDNTLNSKDVK